MYMYIHVYIYVYVYVYVYINTYSYTVTSLEVVARELEVGPCLDNPHLGERTVPGPLLQFVLRETILQYTYGYEGILES